MRLHDIVMNMWRSACFSVVSGGVLCVIGVAAIVVAFPALVRYDADDWISAPVPSST